MASKTALLLLASCLVILTTKVFSEETGNELDNSVVVGSANYPTSPPPLLPPTSPPTPPVKTLPPPSPPTPPVKTLPPPSPSPPPPPTKASPVPYPSPTKPYPPPPPVVYPPPGQPPRNRRECGGPCMVRCKLHSRKNICMRACLACCERCRCVPPGQYGNREKCGKCYANMTTTGGRLKCP